MPYTSTITPHIMGVCTKDQRTSVRDVPKISHIPSCTLNYIAKLMRHINKTTHPMSQALIYESLHLGNKGINQEQLVVNIPYELDVELFKRAWELCFIKHPAALADHNPKTNITTFELGGCNASLFEFIDNSQSNKPPLQTLLQHDRQQSNLIGANSVKIKLIRFGEANYQCIWSFHHAQLDGTSISLIVSEVFDYYESLLQGEKIESPSPDTKYIDYLEQLAQLQYDDAEGYWQKHLDGYSGAIKPNIYESSSTTEKFKKVASETTLAPDALFQLANSAGCRLNNIFQVAWAILIARYCDTQDVTFGTARACRNMPNEDYWHTVGMFMNIIPQRFIFNKDISIVHLLKEARQQQLEHKSFENTPLPFIAQAVKTPTTELLGSLLMYSETPLNQYFIDSKHWRSCTVELHEQSSFPLELIVYSGRTINIKIEGDASLYSSKAIESMLTSLLFIIQQLVATPTASIDSVELIPSSIANNIIFQNNSSIEPTAKPLTTKIENVFKHSGYRLAITEDQEQYSYERLDVLSKNIAANLTLQGLNKGDVVAIGLGRSAKSIICQLGVLRAGGTFVNINISDPSERIEFILSDSNAKYFICDSQDPACMPSTACKAIKYEKIADLAQQKTNLNQYATESDIAYIIYTSGTTGTPKGVAITHANLSNHLAATRLSYGITKDDTLLQFAAHTFDVAIEEIFLCFVCAAHLVIRDEFCISSANTFIDSIESQKITVLNIPTAFWHFLVERMGGKAWPSQLRLLIVGGEEPALSSLRKWRKQNTQHIRWINAYGPTETTITSTIFEDDPDKPLRASASIPIGKPLQNVTHYILDSRKRPLPLGCAGELHIGGLGVAAGYLNRPELNEQKFLNDPFSPGSKMYASGDKAYLKADGNFVYLGRSDTQVKIRGFRIELGEVENACLSHPHVSGCVADKPNGADELAVYIISSHHNITEELIPYLKNKLPPYAVPSRVKVVEHIPLTNSGKLSRKNLTELKVTNEKKVNELTLPRDEFEHKLLEIWNDRLPEVISGVNQSFFEAGGHSLLAVQVFSDIEDEFNTTIDIRHFFGEPTIAWLASELRTRQKGNKPPQQTTALHESENQASVITLQGDGNGIPIYCICGIEIYRSLAASLGTDQPVYGVFLPIEAEMIEQFSQGQEFQLPSVAEMAQSYVDAIIAQTPEGPIGLAGVSFGGLLAFEIAQQLKEKNREIAHLTLMESFLARATQRKGILEWAIEHAIYYLKTPEAIKRIIRRSLDSWRAKKSQLDINSMDDIANVDFSELRWRAYHHAANKYDSEIRPYSGNVTLFKAEQQPLRIGLHIDSTYGWANLVKGELEIFTVPGDHLGVLTHPNVGVLARKLMPRIKSANQLNIRL